MTAVRLPATSTATISWETLSAGRVYRLPSAVAGWPSTVTVTTCHGMNFPLCWSAFFAASSSPPQQGTSIRTTVTLLMSFSRMISVSFSA